MQIAGTLRADHFNLIKYSLAIFYLFFTYETFDGFQNEIKYDFGFHYQCPIFPSICRDLGNALIENA